MPKTISKRDSDVNNNVSGWDKAIEDARKGIRRLELAIQTYEERRASGEPWPGTAGKG
jgi:hypothetical protein